MADPVSAENTEALSNSSAPFTEAAEESPEVLKDSDTKPAPAPVEPEAAQEAKPEPEPEARHLRSVEDKEEKKDAPAPVDWTEKIEALQGEVQEARALVEKMQQEEAARRDKAREALVVGEYGLLDPDYMKIPSFPAEADATTEEGRESLRQWMVKHPGLFGKSPAITKEMKKEATEKITFGAKPWKWSDMWKG